MMLTVMMMMASNLALAADLQPGRLWPSAQPVAAGDGEAGVEYDGPIGMMGAVSVHAAPADRLLVGGSVNYWRLNMSDPTDLSNINEVMLFGLSYVSYDTTPKDHFNVAPFLAMGFGGVQAGMQYDEASDEWINPWRMNFGAVPGWALEGGWDKVRIDASIPTIGVFVRLWKEEKQDGQPYASRGPPVMQLPMITASELGVTYRFNEQQSLRLGTLTLVANLTYRHEWTRAFIEARAGLLTPWPGVGIQGGVRW